MDQQMQQRGGMRRFFGRYGQQTPGNEPGGANGRYGQFGQMPDSQPSDAFHQSVDAMKRGFAGAQSGAPGGGIGAFAQGVGDFAGAMKQRYGQQGRMDHAMNQSQHMRREQSKRANMNGIMGPDSMETPQQQPAPQPQSAAPTDNYGTPTPAPQSPAPVQATGQMQSYAQPAAPQQQTMQAEQPKQNTYASPFGNMNFGQYKRGGMVTKPTLALIGEDGPEAVIPMNGRSDALVTPGMIQPRDTFHTGSSSLHNPLHGLKPVSGPMSHGGMNFKRYNAMHPKA